MKMKPGIGGAMGVIAVRYSEFKTALDAYNAVDSADNALDLIQAAGQFAAVTAVAGLVDVAVGKFQTTGP